MLTENHAQSAVEMVFVLFVYCDTMVAHDGRRGGTMPRAAAASKAHTYVPDTAEGAAIADFVRVLDEAGLGVQVRRPALVAANGETLELPEAMFDALKQVAEALASGMGVTVAPMSAMLTTQEVADYLRISQPTLVRILERGDIPMVKPGRHRYVRLADLVAYQDRAQDERRSALEQMVQDAQAHDLYAKTDRPAPRTR